MIYAYITGCYIIVKHWNQYATILSSGTGLRFQFYMETHSPKLRHIIQSLKFLKFFSFYKKDSLINFYFNQPIHSLS